MGRVCGCKCVSFGVEAESQIDDLTNATLPTQPCSASKGAESSGASD